MNITQLQPPEIHISAGRLIAYVFLAVSFFLIVILPAIQRHKKRKEGRPKYDPLLCGDRMQGLLAELNNERGGLSTSLHSTGGKSSLTVRDGNVSYTTNGLCRNIGGFNATHVISTAKKDVHMILNEGEASIAIATPYGFGREDPAIQVFKGYNGAQVLFECLKIPAFAVTNEKEKKLLVGHLEPDEFREISFNDILGYQIDVNEQTILSKDVSGTAVGGLLAGMEGALLGTLLSDIYVNKEVENVTLKIMVDDYNEPLFSIDMYDSSITSKSAYFAQIDELKAILERIVRRNSIRRDY